MQTEQQEPKHGILAQQMQEKLKQAFAPEKLEIINESHLHAGHQPGFDGTGESHMRIRIISKTFEGMSRVDIHRAVNALMKEEFDRGLHALAIDARAA